MASFTPAQRHLIEQPLDGRIFLDGPAGCGKTTAAVERLLRMLERGIPGDTILLLVPQRTLAEPYHRALRLPHTPAGGEVSILTVGGLAQRMVDLFWPLVAERAGFAHPDALPTFLTLETAQYYMAHLVRPLLEVEHLFESVTIDRNRLYSQILDNLNKAAVVGFPFSEIGERLKAAWIGEPGQSRVYEDVQYCASRFRAYCLEHNLLDFSLQVEVFWQHLWPEPACRDYLHSIYRHLIFDNLEEDTPIAHDLVSEWSQDFDSILLVYDWEAGYRRFLGADPQGALRLRRQCSTQITLADSLVNSEPVQLLEQVLSQVLPPMASPARRDVLAIPEHALPGDLGLSYAYHRFYPQMLDWVVEQISDLVDRQGVPAGEIVVISPYLSDALRFSLTNRLGEAGIPARAHRPSRSLREETVTQCLLTLSALAHPGWGIHPSKYDLAYALVQAIAGMDLVRAQLLAENMYPQRQGSAALASFDDLQAVLQERITYRLGDRVESLRLWLEEAQADPGEFDHFLSRLFGEVLSQPGFGFHDSYAAGEVTANLIESVQKFRRVAGGILDQAGVPLGKEYLLMVQDGVIASQYIRSWQEQPAEAVLLAPAYTFLMNNRPVEVQFWLDVGGRGWSERLSQPLTHPYVLSRQWNQERSWTDADEVETSQDALYCLVLGLVRRCRSQIYLGLSRFNEQGYEQNGPLLLTLQRLLRQFYSGDQG
ncbi:MAG: hypothetical protein JXB15_13810 [Anaerolineales bacterium]|nr:hypothetical protein [Anaerolineales bacterium]